jgi:methylated-DNA-[protein]-cysteine S-methyltransferase
VPTPSFVIFETAIGFCAIGWNDLGITRFHLPARSAISPANRSTSPAFGST